MGIFIERKQQQNNEFHKLSLGGVVLFIPFNRKFNYIYLPRISFYSFINMMILELFNQNSHLNNLNKFSFTHAFSFNIASSFNQNTYCRGYPKGVVELPAELCIASEVLSMHKISLLIL